MTTHNTSIALCQTCGATAPIHSTNNHMWQCKIITLKACKICLNRKKNNRNKAANCLRKNIKRNNVSEKLITENALTLDSTNISVSISLHKQKSNLYRNSRFITCIDYGFGVPFSYWREWDIYPFVSPKYENLKQELLHNTIYTITFERYKNILEKGEDLHADIINILGKRDKNTPWAHYKTHWNDYCGIKEGTLISLQHLLSILFYTDLTQLTSKMKDACRKLNQHETISDVKQRHIEFVHWFKLMTETLILYGNNMSNKDEPIYHGLEGRFYFEQFKAQFHIPTSTTTDRGQAIHFAKEDGIVLQFGGLESVGDPYFDTSAISAYKQEREYLFFRAELNITQLFMKLCTEKFSMLPLSLYQSIINGSIIIDKLLEQKPINPYQKTQKRLNRLLGKIDKRKDKMHSDDEKQKNDVADYGLCILENFIKKHSNIYINHQQIIKKISLTKLRERFIMQDKNKAFCGYSKQLKDFEIHSAETHDWTLYESEYEELKTQHVTTSKIMLFHSADTEQNNLIEFYCQINLKQTANATENNDEKEEEKRYHKTGRMSLILHELSTNNPVQKTITISCDMFCREMEKYYIRFHRQILTLGDRITAVFKWDRLTRAFERYNKIHWVIAIRKEKDN